ncbi:MAG: pyridoxal phosphate-dependent aminotransferase [Actinomycetota bacterium]|nr:pyridoxal phosphate-dependent aminotransferase [Actinomycetota bacterium]MDQ2956664.1 pyridoxal phosphate-dependent aminotransferase [Actinomycetota bacterium]
MSDERLEPSPNLALNEHILRRRQAGESVVHLGFGESQLPVPAFLADRLLVGAQRNAYGQISGEQDCREAAAGYFTRRGIQAEPEQIIFAPGSKPILLALMAALDGPVVLPRPCWVTYAPQARLFGRRVISVPVPPESGGIPDPELLVEAIQRAKAAGEPPRSMVLTMPDNPTGTYPSADTVRRLAEIAEQEDLLIISDEIYRDVVHDPAADITSPMQFAPDRTVVTSGLSKSLSLGGWRIGFARFPATAAGLALRARILAIASEIWSSLAGPMQEVARYALSEPAELVAHRQASTRLHATLATAVYDVMIAAGAQCRRPTGGFYVYPDFEPMRAIYRQHGIEDSATLERHLLEHHGVAVLGGHHFGDDPSALRFRAATSMLYGSDSDERWQTLGSSDPLAMPYLARDLETLREAFGVLGTAPRTLQPARHG